MDKAAQYRASSEMAFQICISSIVQAFGPEGSRLLARHILAQADEMLLSFPQGVDTDPIRHHTLRILENAVGSIAKSADPQPDQ